MIIATVEPLGGHSWQASRFFDKGSEIQLYPTLSDAVEALESGKADRSIIPVYNTREGEIKEYFRIMAKLSKAIWVDNIVLPVQLSLGALDEKHDLTTLVGTSSFFRQCELYIAKNFPEIDLLAVKDVNKALKEIKNKGKRDWGVITTEEIIKTEGLVVRERELVSHNRTRFAVLSREPNLPTGYDATAIITSPLKDRVGLLFDILGEFSKRGINLLDIRSETDIQTQELKIFIEAEGHIEDKSFQNAIKRIEDVILQEPGTLKPIGSYRRFEIRSKNIDTFGFIGTGDMSKWFVKKLESDGYSAELTGRSSSRKPEDMIPDVDVVVICVPISATVDTIKKYGALLQDGQSLILLAGEAEVILDSAMQFTKPGVEVMLVHNLWGPHTESMKDRIAVIVRTSRSGRLCSEFESFLYKHGAEIHHDTPEKHDLLMGVNQKLPTTLSVALAATVAQNAIPPDDFRSHSTLTSLYGILAMARMHIQNPRTYAEIMSTKGEGNKIIRDFLSNLQRVADLSDAGDIESLCSIIKENRKYLTDPFLQQTMAQTLAVDQALGKFGRGV